MIDEFVPDKLHTIRMNICNTCEKLTSIKFCSSCGCFMPVKSRIKTTSCPLGKWTKFIESNNNVDPKLVT